MKILLALGLATLLVSTGCRTTSENGSSVVKDDEDEAEENHAYKRFKPWIETLAQVIKPGDNPEEMAEELIDGPYRVAAFNLQALGKLYRADARFFNDLRKDFKALEDGIGEFDLWHDRLKAARNRNASSREIRSIERKKEEALEELTEFLVDKKFAVERGQDTKLWEYRTQLLTYPWPPYEEEKRKRIGVLIRQLSKVRDTEFDLTRLELDGPGESRNGLHEFRREVRWYLLQARALNGLITFLPEDACSADAFAPLLEQGIAHSRYGTLPANEDEESPCLISRCLFLGLVKLVGDVGDIKDGVEELNLDGDHVPEPFKTQAQEVHDQFRESRLAEYTIGEMDQCIAPNDDRPVVESVDDDTDPVAPNNNNGPL